MTKEQTPIVYDILAELKRAKRRHPRWPDHVVAQAAIVNEEAGELLRASLQYKYEMPGSAPEDTASMRRAKREEIRKEAIQTAAMCVRFIQELDKDHS